MHFFYISIIWPSFPEPKLFKILGWLEKSTHWSIPKQILYWMKLLAWCPVTPLNTFRHAHPCFYASSWTRSACRWFWSFFSRSSNCKCVRMHPPILDFKNCVLGTHLDSVNINSPGGLHPVASGNFCKHLYFFISVCVHSRRLSCSRPDNHGCYVLQHSSSTRFGIGEHYGRLRACTAPIIQDDEVYGVGSFFIKCSLCSFACMPTIP